MDSLPLIPEVPKEIIEASNNNKLAVFIGAGVSRLANCLGWDALANKLIGLCYNEKKSGSNERIINYVEKESLQQLNDQRKIITICQKLLSIENKDDLFYKEMEKALLYKDTTHKKVVNIYSDLAKLSALFITTNADDLFDPKFKNNIKYLGPDFISEKIHKDYLYHIHGSISERTSLIFTLPEYFKRYNSTKFKMFLDKIFNDYSILFVGYGLTEFELLEFLFHKIDNAPKSIQHFILKPYFSHEVNILNMEQRYYADMKTRIIPYCKDQLGFDQLNEVISKWVDDILTNTMIISGRLDEIDEAVS
jgi:hypothetical protein